jgi:F-box/WD-40 domain protein MET30
MAVLGGGDANDHPLRHHNHTDISPSDNILSNNTMAPSPPLTHDDDEAAAAAAPQHNHQQPSKDNCVRRRPQEGEQSRLAKKMPSDLVGKHVSPFLKQHIPGLYAPVGKQPPPDEGSSEQPKDPNTKYCYRHAPDSKCRRAADETKMGIIQRVGEPFLIGVSPCGC